ncbi:MAG: tyrosine-type recombinase/integrase [Limisphaerales bacterium]
MSKPKFPMVVKRGHTIVKIYLTPTRGCEAFTVVHYLGDRRQRKTFADLGVAKTEAERIANSLSTGELNVLTLTNQDGLAYARAVEALKPTGVPLEMAAMQFTEAHKLLEGASLLEAARFYVKQNPHRLPKKLVPEIVAELLRAKEADGMSVVYLKDLRGRLGRFAEAFKGAVSFVTSAEIEDFLRGLKDKGNDQQKAGKPLSGKSRNNYRRAIGTLFYFAESRGYLPKGMAQVDSVAVAREDETDIEIFTPGELMAVLESAEPALVPFLAIGAFAGLRHAEIQRLDWSEVRLDDGFIEVKASKAKTASRRLVPILDNLKQWLAPHRQAEGKVCEYANVSKQLMWLAEAVDAKLKEQDSKTGFAWKHNALRHSFISYRVSAIQNVAQVALEAGNSPRMVFSNYRELVRATDAEKWFAITPEAVEAAKRQRSEDGSQRPANVVALPKAAAA